jgi:ribonucleoside-diphosphate reductase alpha chain
MASHFLPVEAQDEVGIIRREPVPADPMPPSAPASSSAESQTATELKVIASPTTNGNAGSTVQRIAFVNTDAPACPDCGAITVRSGSCYKCLNCGATTGCS